MGRIPNDGRIVSPEQEFDTGAIIVVSSHGKTIEAREREIRMTAKMTAR